MGAELVNNQQEPKKLEPLELENQLTDKLKNIQKRKSFLIAQMIKVKEEYSQLEEDEDLVQTMLMHQYNKLHRGAYIMSQMKKARERGLI